MELFIKEKDFTRYGTFELSLMLTENLIFEIS